MRGGRSIPERGASVHAARMTSASLSMIGIRDALPDPPRRSRVAFSSDNRRMWTAHSTTSPSPPSAKSFTPCRDNRGAPPGRCRGAKGTVHCDLRFASVAPLVERGEIHEREFDRPLKLVNVRRRQEIPRRSPYRRARRARSIHAF